MLHRIAFPVVSEWYQQRHSSFTIVLTRARIRSTSSTSPSTPAYSLPWSSTLTGYLLCGPRHRRRDGAGTALIDTPQIEQRDSLARSLGTRPSAGSSHLLGCSNSSFSLCPVPRLLASNPAPPSGLTQSLWSQRRRPWARNVGASRPVDSAQSSPHRRHGELPHRRCSPLSLSSAPRGPGCP